MKEVKTPKKPLIFYYAVAMLAVFLFNFFAMPWLAQHQIKEVDYNTFVEMVEQDKVGKVEIQEQDNRILFTDKDESVIYKTAMVSDDDLSARLLEAGVSFKGEEIEQTSLLVDILGWVLPILIFIALGQYMSKKMADKLGGGNSMMFGLGGNSNVKVYVQSTEGIHFSDVAGEDEAKENLQEVVDYLHDPQQVSGDRRVHAQGHTARRPSGNRQDHARQGGRRRIERSVLLHLRLRVRGDVRRHGREPRCATCSSRPRKRRPASFSSTRSTPSARSATAASMAATTSASRRSTSC